ncbi:hypothetical protein OCOL_001088 [Ordospora colligata]|uniref:Uncharacterized protein n=1 Tax=Ordospora colligata OC4 TaxID=1354746 RepID=A0A0B2UFX1_9MICR|nr:uncharacterized protein M896_041840 [Ordospora colligata OC4]KHN69986.1 hypothetical protein M896_041840 [Ordospora colligata OC4]TBU16156.1 hypothetical protein CWI41_041830 [Ordospora colligata]
MNLSRVLVQRLIGSQSAIFRAIYMEKRMSKAQLKDVCISSVVAVVMNEEVPVDIGGLVIAGLSKILSRKLKYLSEECGGMVHVMCEGSAEKVKKIGQGVVKEITLGMEGLYIDDDMIDPEEFIVLEEPEEDMGISIDDMSFGANMSGISLAEQIRDDYDDGSMGRSATEVTQIPIEEYREKRRRIVDDGETEYDAQMFRENLRDTRDIVCMKRIDFMDVMRSRLFVAPEILCRIRDESMMRRESVEGVRDEMLMDSYMDISFRNEIETDNEHNEVDSENDSENEENGTKMYFEIGELGKSFSFNSAVGNKSRYERSKSFFCLLSLLGQGKVIANQTVPYDVIKCELC